MLQNTLLWMVSFVLIVTEVSVLRAADIDPLTAEQRRERIKTIRVMLLSFAGEVQDHDRTDPLSLLSEPSLLYADNERELSDASLWVWEHQGQLVALSTVEFKRRENMGGFWTFECASLMPGKLSMTLPGEAWKVPETAVERQPLNNAPLPAATRSLRLLQLRKLADRFSATAHSELQGPIVLRRLSAPVYRQPETTAGDGALFVFANGTNPEVLVHIQSNSDTGLWTYTVTGLSGDALSASLDEREVWRVGRFTNLGTRLGYTNGKLKSE